MNSAIKKKMFIETIHSLSYSFYFFIRFEVLISKGSIEINDNLKELSDEYAACRKTSRKLKCR